MVDKEWLQSNYQITNSSVLKGKEHSPAVLEWGRYKGSCVELFNSDTTCDLDGECIIKLDAGYICSCYNSRSDSYKGCSGDLICNSTGGYHCSGCPHGYKKDGSSCSSSKAFGDLFIFIKKSRARFFAIIEGENEEIMNVANLTRRCLNLNGKKRPTMREVAIELAGNTRASVEPQWCSKTTKRMILPSVRQQITM
ncbi:hypothetical protein Patl1_23174 [Pistacia atlantica]|uniref:Uncharacterized protein n=1 Tax=Pistacia atlantica TaxID=434234 RepID=A0ACC0ZYJ5_9ROSI|nr:hypothetical protein Patl1_23174 [Pistacia atlantica]